mmetsp:Transcript_49020/g.140907  ORF Transcript_49020/g.140907 Transcript_49020/m.140907 type:complete len:569 (-) Transcript_49020:45-1751(-)
MRLTGPASPQHETVFQVVMLVLFCIKCSLFVRQSLFSNGLLRAGSVATVIVAKGGSAVRGLRALIFQAGRDGDEPDEFAKQVAQQLVVQRDKNMRMTLRALSNTAFLFGAIVAAAPYAMPKHWSRSTALSMAQDWWVMAVSMLSLVGRILPRRFTAQTEASMRLALQMILLSLAVLASRENLMFMFFVSLFLGMVRLIVSMSSLSVCEAAAWNGAALLLTSYRYTQLPGSVLHVVDEEDILLSVSKLAVTEVFVFVAVVVCTAAYTGVVRSQIRHQLQEAKLRGDSAATTRMLELVCDVVVELDSDLAITDNAQRFAAMLSLNPANVKGTHMQDYMLNDEDRQRFEQRLLVAKDDPEGSLPGVAHVTLRDSCGTRISAEVFYLHFRRSGDDRMLVGIQETPDYRPVAELRKSHSQHSLFVAPGAGSEGEETTEEDAQPASSTYVSPSGSQAMTGSSLSARSLLVRQCRRTTKRAEDLSLLGCLLSWNAAVRTSACCAYHGYIHEASKCLDRLRSRRCIRTFCPSWEAQCKECGLFAYLEPSCDGSDLFQECGGCHAKAVTKIRNSTSL